MGTLIIKSRKFGLLLSSKGDGLFVYLLANDEDNNQMNYSLTLKSKKLDEEFSFYNKGNLILVKSECRNPHILCSFGHFTGSIVKFNQEEEEDFKKTCKRWYKTFIKRFDYYN